MEDKKVALLYGILICAILVLGVGVLSFTFGNNDNEGKNTKTTLRVSTKTRRATTSTDEVSTSSNTTTTSNSSSVSTTPKTSSTSSATTVSSSSSTKKITTSKSTKKTTTTKKKTTTTKKKTTTSIVTIPPNIDRETTDESTTYPLAQDDMEWAIFDMINKAREEAGYKYVRVATEFRTLAEEGADYLYDFGDAEVKKYLYGFNNYRRFSNHLMSVDQAVLSLYTATIKNTPVITDPSIRYVGIGVIFREIGLGDLPTYYYVIIYE